MRLRWIGGWHGSRKEEIIMTLHRPGFYLVQLITAERWSTIFSLANYQRRRLGHKLKNRWLYSMIWKQKQFDILNGGINPCPYSTPLVFRYTWETAWKLGYLIRNAIVPNQRDLTKRQCLASRVCHSSGRDYTVTEHADESSVGFGRKSRDIRKTFGPSICSGIQQLLPILSNHIPGSYKYFSHQKKNDDLSLYANCQLPRQQLILLICPSAWISYP